MVGRDSCATAQLHNCAITGKNDSTRCNFFVAGSDSLVEIGGRSVFFPLFSEMKNFRDAEKFRTFGEWKKKIHATGLSLTELPNRKKRSHRIIKRVGRNERARRQQRCHRTLWLEERFLRTEIFSARKLFLQEIYERALRDHGSRP